MNWQKICGLSLIIAALTGCNRHYNWWGPSSDVSEEVVYQEEIKETTYAATPAPAAQAESPDPAKPEAQAQPCGKEEVEPVIIPPVEDNDQFVDYRRTAAEYRSYGERTPRDQYYTAAGAGNNLSSAIPPAIEDEVGDYEDAVNEAFNEAVSESLSGDVSEEGEETVEDWLAEEGNTLRGLLTEWCERAGWRLIWNSNRNYTLAAGAMFRGRFADVSAALIRSFARARPAPLATFYKGNRVLVVETKEDENAYN